MVLLTQNGVFAKIVKALIMYFIIAQFHIKQKLEIIVSSYTVA